MDDYDDHNDHNDSDYNSDYFDDIDDKKGDGWASASENDTTLAGRQPSFRQSCKIHF